MVGEVKGVKDPSDGFWQVYCSGNRQTDTRDNYRNPRAYAPRVNKVCRVGLRRFDALEPPRTTFSNHIMTEPLPSLGLGLRARAAEG